MINSVIIALSFLIFIALAIVVYLTGLNQKLKGSLAEKSRALYIQNKIMDDNVRIAGKILKTVLPSKEIMTNILPHHFLIDICRDKISGDFCIVRKHNGKVLIAVADCTGHDVKGALLTLQGISVLDEILLDYPTAATDEILNHLRRRMTSSIITDINEDNDNNIDISLCIIDYKTHDLQFSGARSSAYLLQDNELKELSGDKMPVIIFSLFDDSYRKQDIKLKKGDVLYMCTDGYHDQFGGPNKKKFGKKRLKELLLNIHQKPMDEQEKVLLNVFTSWKMNHKTVDDAIVLGVKME
jgi:serine phosphatase RsbU (regulator of sigma subunit)